MESAMSEGATQSRKPVQQLQLGLEGQIWARGQPRPLRDLLDHLHGLAEGQLIGGLVRSRFSEGVRGRSWRGCLENANGVPEQTLGSLCHLKQDAEPQR